MEERELDPRHRQRQEGMCVGLRNIGNTCYVNSLLQTYFLLPAMRDAILSANATEGMPPTGETLPPTGDLDPAELEQAIALSMEGQGSTNESETADSKAAPKTDARRREAITCLWQLQRVFALLCHSHRR